MAPHSVLYSWQKHEPTHDTQNRFHSHEFHGHGMDPGGNIKTNAFQWKDHYGTSRLIHWHSTSNGLCCKDTTWRS